MKPHRKPGRSRTFAAAFVTVAVLAAGMPCGFASLLIVPDPPSPDVDGYILVDFRSGAVIAGKNPDEPAEPASITKLMTAYLVYEALAKGDVRLDDEVKISERAWKTGGSRMFVEVNSLVSVKDLLMGVVVQSGNDASVALAEHVAGSESAFVDMMNAKAAALGMTGSRFANATGLPEPGHEMTARDIALLSQALIRDYPQHYAAYSARKFTYNNIKQFNRNRLLWRDSSVDGLKTGHTESAGYCLAASAQRGDMRLISVILGSGSEKQRSAQTAGLLDYGFRFFETYRLYKALEPLDEVRVWGGEPGTLQLGAPEDVYVTVPRGGRGNLTLEKRLLKEIDAPIAAMRTLGIVKVSYRDRFSWEVPLVALSDISLGDFFTRGVDWFLRLF